MGEKLTRLIFVILITVLLSRCSSNNLSIDKDKQNLILSLPNIKREFRGVWVATINNLDWPKSKDKLEQIKEIDIIIQAVKDMNMNAIILQVRPSGDAFYKSKYEPYSSYLTGSQDIAPDYDPLEIWIKKAHEQGIQLHAWINPLRVGTPSLQEYALNSPIYKDFTYKLNKGFYWIDPGIKKARNYICNIVYDIISNYKVDAIHIDDYLYPYSDYLEKNEDFPDKKVYKEYKNKGGNLNKSEWRRENANELVQSIYKTIKEYNYKILFGISPFGIWQPGYPEEIKGKNSYQEIYSDSKKWVENGWADYFSPQLYWPIYKTDQSFPLLLSWWKSINTKKRHLWVGINLASKYTENKDKASEYSSQIYISRTLLGDDAGVLQFRMSWLLENIGGIKDTWINKVYKKSALVPKTKWVAPYELKEANIKIKKYQDDIILDWSYSSSFNNARQIIYIYYKNTFWDYEIIDKNLRTKTIKQNLDNQIEAIMIIPTDILGNEGKKKIILI